MYKHTFSNTLNQLEKFKNVSIFFGVDVNLLETYWDTLMI